MWGEEWNSWKLVKFLFKLFSHQFKLVTAVIESFFPPKNKYMGHVSVICWANSKKKKKKKKKKEKKEKDT